MQWVQHAQQATGHCTSRTGRSADYSAQNVTSNKPIIVSNPTTYNQSKQFLCAKTELWMINSCDKKQTIILIYCPPPLHTHINNSMHANGWEWYSTYVNDTQSKPTGSFL